MVVYTTTSPLARFYTQLTTTPTTLLPASSTLLTISGITIACLVAASLIAHLAGTSLRTILVFGYNCFLQPLGKTKNQGERLDRFYQNQADGECILFPLLMVCGLLTSPRFSVYDATRSGLLRGRSTMLK
jgi:betaine lipid synthase